MRFYNWPELLHKFIESRKNTPFARGTNDCCVFAADAVKEITSIDFAEGFRGTYSDDKGALKLAKELGGIRVLATSKLGKEIAPLFAQRGDVVLVNTERGEALSICMGSYVIGTGTHGLVKFSLSSAICAWRVV